MKFRIKDHFTTYSGLPKEIYLLFCSRVISCVGSFILPLLTLILTQKLGMSKTEAGSFSALLILSQAPCLLIGGKLIDAIGRKKVLVACHILGSISYLICGFTQSHTMLVFIVIGADLFVAASPAYQAMVAELTTPENRKASFSLLYLGINVGMAISPVIGGLLFKDYLQLLFILDGATTLASTLLIAFLIKEPENNQQNEVLATEGKSLDKSVSVFSVLKTSPILFFFIIFIFVYYFTYTQWGFMLPLQFGDLYGDNGAQFYSILNVVNPIIVVTCTPLLTRLTKKLHPLAVISGGGLLYFVSFAFFAFVRNLPLFMLAGAIFTFGEIVVTINTGAFIANHSPSAHLGRINALYMFIQGTANALGPLIMGHVISMTNYLISWLLMAFFILAGAVSMYLLNKKESRENIQAEQCDLPAKP
jgi:MFS family permease